MNHYLREAATTMSTGLEAPIIPGQSRVARWIVGIIAAIGLTASVLASATMWLVVSDPVTASSAISTGDVEALLRMIGAAIVDVLQEMVGYL